MKLVYPVYLDTPMMTGFLASLEGGIIEEADIESRTGDSTEKGRTISSKAGISGLLSGILGVGIEGEFARKVSESLESQYKSTVRFPNAALFIRLRNLLLEQELVTSLKSVTQINDLSIGEIVEFQGLGISSPGYQIRHAFSQIQPLIEAYYDLIDAQLDQQVVQLENARSGDILEVGDETITIENRKQASAMSSAIKATQKAQQKEAELYQRIDRILQGLFPEDSSETVLFKAEDFQAVCRVYPAFMRNERIQEIYDANWHCLGKVIGIICESEEYDLLKGSPISYFAKGLFPELASSLKNENLNIEVTEPVISGPSIIVATMAIFV